MSELDRTLVERTLGEEPPVAIVTGGANGLGKAITNVLLDKGYRCCVADVQEDALARFVVSSGAADRLLPLQGDVTSPSDRKRIVVSTVETFGQVDLLVNNAGIAPQSPMLRGQDSEWQKVMAVNIDAVFFLSQAVIPVMAERGFGRIVNIGSVYASHARNGALYEPALPRDTPEGPMSQFSYHASKGAVVNLTRELAVAVGPMGITVNTVSPGMFRTEQTKNLLDETVAQRLTQMTPIPRFGEPAEIGYAIAFLASKEASFITGMDLRVDGGWTLW